MIVLMAVVLYAVFVLGGIQFFRQVHMWDEQALKMWEEELLRSQSGKTRQLRAQRNSTARKAGNSSPARTIPKLAQTTLSLEN